MASMTFTAPVDLIKQLEHLEKNSEGISKKALKAGAKTQKSALERTIKQVMKKPTGALEASIKTENPKRDKRGNLAIITGFDGYDSKGVPNDLKANVLEYGSTKQRATPFVRPAVEESEESALDAMEKVIDEEVAKFEP